MEIDKNIIKRNESKYKKLKFLEEEKLKKEFYTSLKKYELSLTKLSAYEIALWIESSEKHLSALKQNNFTKYRLGEIILIDLGWNNYDREFAYIHPAIVVKETATKLFVVPCSSGEPRRDKKEMFIQNLKLVQLKMDFRKIQ